MGDNAFRRVIVTNRFVGSNRVWRLPFGCPMANGETVPRRTSPRAGNERKEITNGPINFNALNEVV